MRAARLLPSLTLAIAALGAATACGDAGADAVAGPRPVVGRFTLRTLDGGPLPAVVERAPVAASPEGPAGRLEEMVTSATLVLVDAGDDTLHVRLRMERTLSDGAAAVVTTRELTVALPLDDVVCPIDFRGNARAACPDSPMRSRGDSIAGGIVTGRLGAPRFAGVFVREGR